jgi:methylthioribose-1-phosphate isomerase
LIDQTKLPNELVYLDCRTIDDVWHAIKNLSVRGAPAIGVAAAYGMVLAGQAKLESVPQAGEFLKSSRPTAINLAWAIDRMVRVYKSQPSLAKLLGEAHAIRNEDAAMCRAIGQNGAKLMPTSGGVLTHCNAGGLATAEFGTALACIFAAWDQGQRFTVYVDETRPLLQGSRLTAWELQQYGIDHTVICDNMAGMLMKGGKIHAVVVGADRIAANGDTANKIGTYAIAVLAKHHGIPFFVAAPSSTFDLSLPNGLLIPIEERHPTEITQGFGQRTAPVDSPAYNPAFDVTPAELITGVVTELGVVMEPNAAKLTRLLADRPFAEKERNDRI